MNNDLVERYIYAVTRRLIRKQREDVAQELRGLVDDMLTERCGNLTPTEKDVRVVLTELGTPQELYAQYDVDADKCLIGQPYYSTYLFVLKIVLLSVAAGLTISNLILQIMEPQGFFEGITSWFAYLWDGLIGSFAFVTLLFAFFYRKGVRINEPFNFDDLPPVPKKSELIPKWECIAGIVFMILFVVIFLVAPQILCIGVTDHRGGYVPVFDVEKLRGTWYIIISFAVCGIIRETVQLTEGRYNNKVMVTALVTNLVSAVLVIWWLVGFSLINIDFLGNIGTVFGEAEASGIVYQIFCNFDLFLLGVMLFALLLDSIDVTVKTLRK